MKYNIAFKDNKVFFTNSYAKGIITLTDNYAEISMIKVERAFRGLGYAKQLMKILLHFIQKKLTNIKKVFLSPLPVDYYGLNKEELIVFYSKFNFKPSNIPPQYAPNMMEKYI